MTDLTPPKAPTCDHEIAGTQPSAVSVLASAVSSKKRPIPVLKKRQDFVAAAKARRQGTQGMMLQGRNRQDDGEMRMGFTCSKKVGNAVARNRAKRRLREAARMVLPDYGRAGWDYVLIGRADATAQRPLDALKHDLIYALNKIHAK